MDICFINILSYILLCCMDTYCSSLTVHYNTYCDMLATLGMLNLFYLNAHDNAPILDQLGKVGAIVCALVQGLVEEDDAADALVNALVGCKEELAVQAAVLFRVLNADGVQPLGHASCFHAQTGSFKFSIYLFIFKQVLFSLNCN